MYTTANPTTLTTSRLVLRRWRDTDLTAARGWHTDPTVMRHLGGTLDTRACDATVRRWEVEWDERGYGMFAVCPAGTSRPIGAVGLGRPAFDSHFTPCVEIGWRFGRTAWGNGYAVEAARAVLRDGVDRVGLTEIVAFAAAANTASHQVMARLGMRHDVDGGFLRRTGPRGRPVAHLLWRIHADEQERTP